MTRTALVVIAACLAAAPVATARPDFARIYVAVVDGNGNGKPVKGLTAKDFTVKEGGLVKEIVSAEPATTPMSVLLLTDKMGGDKAYNAVDGRLALQSIVLTLRKGAPETQIGLFTFDNASILQVRPSAPPVDLDSYLRKLFPSGSDQDVLLEAVNDAAVLLGADKSDHRVILAMVAGYKPDLSTIRAQNVAEALRKSGTALWALEGRSANNTNTESSNRDLIMDKGTALSGGMRDRVLVGTALESRGKRIAEILLSEYAITYGAPVNGSPTLEVTTSVKNAKVFAPAWTPR